MDPSTTRSTIDAGQTQGAHPSRNLTARTPVPRTPPPLSPRRVSTTAQRVTRSRAARPVSPFQGSSLSPPPPNTSRPHAINGNAIGITPATETILPSPADPVNRYVTPDLTPMVALGSVPGPDEPRTPVKKRKEHPTDSDSDDSTAKGPLLSEYMCPICFSPPKNAIITPCGHILCGSCLHGAITARPGATQHLCPVCRTPIPDLRFKLPETRTNPDTPLNVLNGPDYIDVDQEEERWDPARSGVIGLEILTMGKL